MKKLIKSRRGVAIELAVGVMFLMMAFTIMLLSTAGLQNSLRVEDYDDFNEMVEVNNIGEYVCANIASYNDANNKAIEIDNKDTGYTITEGENSTYTISKDGNVVLTIRVDSSGKIISSWN